MEIIWNKVKHVIFPVLFLTFTCCIFAPLELYITNASNFPFNTQTLLRPIILFFLVTFLIVLLLNIFLQKHIFIVALTFSLGAGFYIQGNWMQVDYGIMDGGAIDWNSYGSWGIINGIIWIFILIIPVVLCFIIKNKQFYRSFLTYISCGAIIMQCITLAVVAFTTDTEKNLVYVEKDEEMYQLSQEKNIVVMLFDAFQASYFRQVLDEIPEAKKHFDGFTFFDNATSTSLYSQESEATIFTGKQMLEDKNLLENVKYIYSESEILSALEQEDYDIRYYVPSEMVSPDMVGEIKNLGVSDGSVDSLDLMHLMLKITAFRYMPHCLKNIFWFSYEELDGLDRTDAGTSFVPGNDFEFYEDIVNEKVNSNLENKAYRVYYFKGAHHPYNMTPEVEYVDYGEDKDALPYVENISENEMLYGQVLGSVRIMMEYITKLKEQGIYDQTAILITADHGWENRYNPMLLMKPENSTGDLVISHAPVSYIKDFEPTVLNAIDTKYTEEKTIYDYQEGEKRYREIYVYENINPADRSYSGISIYGTYGDADDVSSYMVQRNAEDLEYTLGDKVEFTIEGGRQAYFTKGFSDQEDGYFWSLNESSEMKLNIGEISDDLLAEFFFKYVLAGSQQVIVKAGNTILWNGAVTANNPQIEFNIPKECVTDGMLTLTFDYPEACTPASVDPESSDLRVLAIAFSGFIIEEANGRYANMAIQEGRIEKTGQIDFSQTGNCAPYLGIGWHGQEADRRWTSEKAELTLLFEAGDYDLISIDAIPYGPSGATEIFLNGEKIGEIETEGTREFLIPEQIVKDGDVQILTFITENATSPRAVGASEDSRQLGIFVSQIKLLKSR